MNTKPPHIHSWLCQGGLYGCHLDGIYPPDSPETPRAWDDLDDSDFDEEADAERSFQAWQSEYGHNSRG